MLEITAEELNRELNIHYRKMIEALQVDLAKARIREGRLIREVGNLHGEIAELNRLRDQDASFEAGMTAPEPAPSEDELFENRSTRLRDVGLTTD